MATSSSSYDYTSDGDYLDSSDASTYNFTTGTFVCLAWVTTDTAATNYIMGNVKSSGAGWGFGVSSGSDGVMHVNKSGVADVTSALSVSTSTTTGVAAQIRNGTDVIFYKRILTGLSTDTQTAANNILTSDQSFKVGLDISGFTRGADGAINHAQILSGAQGTNVINNALMCPGSVANGLIFYAPGYGQLSPETDLSTTGADGTVTGAPSTRKNACLAIPQQMPVM